MKVIGIVAEYNPFHNGHKYQIEKIKAEFPNSHVISLMSGSFIQRGEPAIIDKWSRAKMALDSGVDLVLELPAIYSTQTAELFARGSIRILDSLNIVDYISFGSEYGCLDSLTKIAEVLVNEPEEYRRLLNLKMSKVHSFPVARASALSDYLKNPEIESILKDPNNILGVEYIKEILSLNSKIRPLTIQRKGGGYKDSSLDQVFASATAIRKNITRFDDIKAFVPPKTLDIIKSNLDNLNNLRNYEQILLYLLRTMDTQSMDDIFDADAGLGNRVISRAKKFTSLEKIISSSTSKTHTKTRVQRVLIQVLLGIKKSDVLETLNQKNQFIRVLSSNEKGLEILRMIKDKSDVLIINKFSDYKKHNNSTINYVLGLEEKATDIFYLPLKNKPVAMDFYTSPYIKKSY